MGISKIVLKFAQSRMSYKSRIRKALCAPTVAAAPGDTRWAHSPPQEPMRGHARAAAVACVYAAGRVGGPDRLFNGHAEPGTGWWCAMLLVARVVSSLLATRRPRGWMPTLGQAHGVVRGDGEAPARPTAGRGRVYRPSLRAETCCTHYTGGKRVQDEARAVPDGG